MTTLDQEVLLVIPFLFMLTSLSRGGIYLGNFVFVYQVNTVTNISIDVEISQDSKYDNIHLCMDFGKREYSFLIPHAAAVHRVCLGVVRFLSLLLCSQTS